MLLWDLGRWEEEALTAIEEAVTAYRALAGEQLAQWLGGPRPWRSAG